MSEPSTYAFDDVSILHTCSIDLPQSFAKFLGHSKLHHKNCGKILLLIERVDGKKLEKYRFEPTNLEENTVRVVNQLFEKHSLSNTFMVHMLKAEIISQYSKHLAWIKASFVSIKKDQNIQKIVQVFIQNEIQLKDKQNMPQDGDLEIIAGYMAHPSKGTKYLVSEDQHFCAYKSIIKNHFGIDVIEEWDCDKVLV